MPSIHLSRVMLVFMASALVMTMGCKKKESESVAEEPSTFAPFGAAEESEKEEPAPLPTSAQAFAGYDLESLRKRWDGMWVLQRPEMWRVSEHHVGRSFPGQRLRRDRFVLGSPCALILSHGEGAERDETVIHFLSDANTLWTVEGPAGFVTDGDKAVVCHDRAVTVFDGESCARWTSTWIGEGDEAAPGWTRHESACGFEEKDVEGTRVQGFVYQGTDGAREVLRRQGALLYNLSTALDEVEAFDDQNKARTRYNALTRPQIADQRPLGAIMNEVRATLGDREKSGSVRDPWFDIDTSSRYEDVTIKGCELSARRVFVARDGDGVQERSEKISIDFAAIDPLQLREQEGLLATAEARARAARLVHIGAQGAVVESCGDVRGASCETVDGKDAVLMFQTGAEARKALNSLRRATMLCRADDD